MTLHDSEVSLDAWCGVVLPPGEEMESMIGRRRYGSLETHVVLVSDLSQAIDLLFSTTLAVEVEADAGCLEWCAAINRDAGLNRFVIYSDGVLTIQTQFVLPKQPGVSAAAMYLVGIAVSHQRHLGELFAEGGPIAVVDALTSTGQAAALSAAPLEVASKWPDALEAAARARLPRALQIRRHPRGVSLVWNGGDPSRRLSATVEASLVDHPIWGPSLDRRLVVGNLEAGNNVDLAGALNRSRLPGVAGSGAWSVSLVGELSHRVTLPLAVLDSAEELRRSSLGTQRRVSGCWTGCSTPSTARWPFWRMCCPDDRRFQRQRPWGRSPPRRRGLSETLWRQRCQTDFHGY